MEKRKNFYSGSKLLLVLKILLIIILSPIILIYLVTKLILSRKQKQKNAEKIKICAISQVDALSGREFEQCLAQLYQKMGYKVSLTKASKDFGADLIIEKLGKKSIVQAKCYSKTVGVRSVQEIISARSHYKTFDAIVVSNQEFSSEACVLAKESSVKLVGREELARLLQKFEVYINFSEKKGGGALSEIARSQIMSKYRYWI